MRKKIIYLDQNFVSNLAKVENVPSWKDHNREYYKTLLGILRYKVSENRLACPTSNFHHTVERLSRKLSFHSGTEIRFAQIALAAHTYCHTLPINAPQWTLSFNQDPHHHFKPADLVDNDELLSNLVEIPFQANGRSVRYSRHLVDLAAL